MGLNQILITLGLIAIFSIAFLNFGIGFGNNQDTSININQDDSITDAKTSVEGNSNSFILNSNASEEVMQKSTIESSSQSGSFSKISIFTDPLTKPFTVLTDMFVLIGATIFGGDNQFGVIFGIIITIIGLIALFAGYKLLKGGNPE